MREQLLKIAELCLRINEETEFAAFMEIPGHVPWISVSVGKSKEQWDIRLLDAHYVKKDDGVKLNKVISALEVFFKGYELIPTGKKVIPERVIEEYVKVVI